MQEVKQLEDQKSKAKDKENEKAIELKLKLKKLERQLAYLKRVSQRHNFTMHCMLSAMKWVLVLCCVVCGEQLLTPCVVDTRLVVYICISDGYLLVEVCQVYLLAKVV